jgi:hypothetical protein
LVNPTILAGSRSIFRADSRQIAKLFIIDPNDGKIPRKMTSWLGDSVGWWENDTVEVYRDRPFKSRLAIVEPGLFFVESAAVADDRAFGEIGPTAVRDCRVITALPAVEPAVVAGNRVFCEIDAAAVCDRGAITALPAGRIGNAAPPPRVRDGGATDRTTSVLCTVAEGRRDCA